MLQVLHQNIELVHDSVCNHVVHACVSMTESCKSHITAICLCSSYSWSLHSS